MYLVNTSYYYIEENKRSKNESVMREKKTEKLNNRLTNQPIAVATNSNVQNITQLFLWLLLATTATHYHLVKSYSMCSTSRANTIDFLKMNKSTIIAMPVELVLLMLLLLVCEMCAALDSTFEIGLSSLILSAILFV